MLTRNLLGVLLFASLLSSHALAESAAGKGGPFMEYHATSISAFDAELTGSPLVLGGSGVGLASKHFRLGGAGGAGFLWNPSQNVQFGLGYGGLLGEYVITNWLNVRLVIGGGGYAVAKIVSETESERTLEKLSSGGFFLFHPTVNADIPINNMLRLSVGLGYFLPNVSQLQSATFTVALNIGKQ